MAINGKLYGVQVGADFIPCEIDCEINISADMVDKSGSHGGKYKQYRYGYRGWSISCNARAFVSALASSSNSLIKAQLDGTPLQVFIRRRQSNIKQIELGGSVLIPSQALSFGKGLATHTITFQGTGGLTSNFEL